MLTKIKAIFHLQFIFFLSMLCISIIPFLIISRFLPEIPNMHLYFIGLIALVRFMLPQDLACNRSKIKTYLVSKQLYSSQNLVNYEKLARSSKDLFLIIMAMIIFFIGMR